MLFSAAVHSASAADDRLNLSYLKGYVTDTGGILASPPHWERRDWATAGGVAAVTAGIYTADAAIHRSARKNFTTKGDDVANIAEHFGNGATLLPGLAGAYLAGKLAEDARLRRAGMYGFEGVLVSGLFTNVLKGLGHRHRPYTGDSRATWDGASTRSNADFTSFPSGHATAAFAAMTAVALEYHDSGWVPPAAYGLAGLTAASRVYQNKHWASDVVLGSAIGYFTTRAIILYHHKEDSGKLSFLPELQTGPAEVRLTWRF